MTGIHQLNQERFSMRALTREQIDTFWRDGVLVVENAVDPEDLTRLREEFGCWVEESRSHIKDFGECMDGRPRFDLQPGHSAPMLCVEPTPLTTARS